MFNFSPMLLVICIPVIFLLFWERIIQLVVAIWLLIDSIYAQTWDTEKAFYLADFDCQMKQKYDPGSFLYSFYQIRMRNRQMVNRDYACEIHFLTDYKNSDSYYSQFE